MTLVLLLSWPYFRKHKTRSLLTLTSVVLGVAVYIAMQSANQGILAAFGRAVDRMAGAAQLQITSGDNGFPEEVLEKVQALPEIRAAAPVVEAVVFTDQAAEGGILVLGVDMLSDGRLRNYDLEEDAEEVIEDPLVFLAQPDSILVTRQLAERRGWQLNSPVALRTMQGRKTFRVRGLMRAGGLASVYGGSLAIMDLHAAQLAFGRGRTFDRIDVALQEGSDLGQVRRRLQASLGVGFQIEPPSGRSSQFEAITRSLAISIRITSLFALLIGVFIVYSSFSIAVAERRPEIGILRALGAPRRRIISWFLAEAALAGLLGALVGIPAGRLLAAGIGDFLGRLVQQSYGTPALQGGPEIAPLHLWLGLGLGVAGSLLGALLPARAAARQDPVQVLGKGHWDRVTPERRRARRRLAMALLAAVAACLAWTAPPTGFYASYLLAVAAVILLAPSVTVLVVQCWRPLLSAWRPVEGKLAADSLLRAPQRTASTVTALMLSAAMAVGFAGIAAASRQSLRDWLDNGMTFDLFLTPAEAIGSRTVRFPAALGEGLRQLGLVEEVQPVRLGRVPFSGSQIMLMSTDVSKLARRIRFQMVEGRRDQVISQVSQGKGVLISENLSLIHKLHRGDVIELGTPAGPLAIPVAGVHVDHTDQQGSMLMDRSLYLSRWGDDAVDVFRVYLKPGVSQSRGREQILGRFAEAYPMFAMTTAEIKQYILRVADQWFALTYWQLAVAVLVAALGIVNSLTVSILDRRRELGVLQAVGGLRSQIRRAIWMEAGAISLTGLTLGTAVGALLLYFNVYLMRQDAFGYRFEYLFPAGFAAALWPVITAAAVLAALWPAESAVRVPLVKALEYE